MENMSNSSRLVCVTLWHSEEAGMNDLFGENWSLGERIEGSYEGQRSLDLLQLVNVKQSGFLIRETSGVDDVSTKLTEYPFLKVK